MKDIIKVFILLTVVNGYTQPNTEVYLLDLLKTKENIQFSNLRNVSNNPGYDNQPSFWDNNTLLFSSTRNDQTDIAKYNTDTGTVSWLTNTPWGSEYSPLRIPKKDAISAIRLEGTGYQRLYKYDLLQESFEKLLKGKKVGYHLWYDDHTLATTVLVENRMNLMVSNLKEKHNTIHQQNVGRSLQKIPNTSYMSYISKTQEPWAIRSMDPITGTTQDITEVLNNSEDICWLQDGTLLTGMDSSIYRWNPKAKSNWTKIWDFNGDGIKNITRLAINPEETLIALVGEEPMETVVDKKVKSFNSGDLETFTNCFSEDVLVQNFPNDTLYLGRKKLIEKYERYMLNHPGAQLNVEKRITIGDIIIDEEIANNQGKQSHQAIIYEIRDGEIESMTFIHEREKSPNALNPVKQQLHAYNARDINAFLLPFSDTVEVYYFPNELHYIGTQKMRKGYADFFKSTPDLHCKIQNRIHIGNKVIDEEKVTVNGKSIHAVAIYEVEDDTIQKVTFIRQ